MTTKTTPQLANPPPDTQPPGRWLRIARVGAMLFMAFCIVTFVWGLLLFSRYGLANLDAIRPNDNWSDETLLTVIAAAGLSVARLGYAQLAVDVLAALSIVAVGLVIDALLAELVRVVDETLQPEHVSVWLKDTPLASHEQRNVGLRRHLCGSHYGQPGHAFKMPLVQSQ